MEDVWLAEGGEGVVWECLWQGQEVGVAIAKPVLASSWLPCHLLPVVGCYT